MNTYCSVSPHPNCFNSIQFNHFTFVLPLNGTETGLGLWWGGGHESRLAMFMAEPDKLHIQPHALNEFI